jgi:UDP-N-acetylglucosamine--dolichyl-phosphate N-acetylglucosaminephosphotransferase
MVPNQLRALLGDYMDLGYFFYVFLLLLAVFSTHAINIYAGVNGLEVGQAVVIGASVLTLNIVHLHQLPTDMQERRQHHVESLFMIMPFLAVSVALFRLNWFPSKVFVGDTFCYFAGMTFAVVAIVGHNSKTVLLLLIPQLLNTVYSLPQLFKLVPCPRHRLPGFDQSTGYVTNSYMEYKVEELRPAGRAVHWLLKTFRLARVHPPGSDGTVRVSNLTLINFVLFLFGSCREDVLCRRLLILQLICTLLCFSIRFGFSGLFYDMAI